MHYAQLEATLTIANLYGSITYLHYFTCVTSNGAMIFRSHIDSISMVCLRCYESTTSSFAIIDIDTHSNISHAKVKARDI